MIGLANYIKSENMSTTEDRTAMANSEARFQVPFRSAVEGKKWIEGLGSMLMS